MVPTTALSMCDMNSQNRLNSLPCDFQIKVVQSRVWLSCGQRFSVSSEINQQLSRKLIVKFLTIFFFTRGEAPILLKKILRSFKSYVQAPKMCRSGGEELRKFWAIKPINFKYSGRQIKFKSSFH